MNLTNEQLEQVKELSALFLSPEEIASYMDLDFEPFLISINDHSSQVYAKFLKGKTESKKEIRENVLKMAKHGSPAAEELAEKYIKQQELDERKNARKTDFT